LLDYLEAGDRLDDFPTVSRERAVAFLELGTRYTPGIRERFVHA